MKLAAELARSVFELDFGEETNWDSEVGKINDRHAIVLAPVFPMSEIEPMSEVLGLAAIEKEMVPGR